MSPVTRTLEASVFEVSRVLQMLNCCIERKRAREETRKVLEGSRERRLPPPEPTAAREVSPGKSWDSWSDSEEEFFECLSDQGDMEAEKDGSKSRAEGRLHPFNNTTLLHCAEPLYVPVTQVRLGLYDSRVCIYILYVVHIVVVK